MAIKIDHSRREQKVKKKTPAKLMQDVGIVPLGSNLPVPEGFDELTDIKNMVPDIPINMQQATAFLVFAQTFSKHEAAKAANVTIYKMARWMNSNWWYTLSNLWMGANRESFLHRINSLDDQLIAKYELYLKGKLDSKEGKTLHSFIEMKFKMGRGHVKPIIQAKHEHEFLINKVADGGLTEDMVRRISREASKEEFAKFALTGVIPNKFLTTEDEITEAEYVEVKDEGTIQDKEPG